MIENVFTDAPEWNEKAFLEAHQQPAAVSIRYNPARFTDQERPYGTSVVPWCANGVYLEERPVFTLDPLLHAGAYYVQEASSMFIAHVFRCLFPDSERPPIKVLDLCAAPGGKSTLMASLLQPDDLLVSNEVIQQRASVLTENMIRWGYMNAWVSQNDPKEWGRQQQMFDLIIVDAPCTGSGLWRKDPGAMNEWSPAHVTLCSERQRRILADVYPALKPGGYLIYATCSYSPAEDEAVAEWFARQFHAEKVALPVPEDWGIVVTQSDYAEGYRFYPWRVKGEGFFCSVFRKSGEELPVKDASKRQKQKGAKSGKEHDAAAMKIWQEWLEAPFEIVKGGDTSFALQPQYVSLFEEWKHALQIRKAGTALGRVMHKDLVPAHDLAMSISLSEKVPRVPLTKEEALKFLKKEPVLAGNDIKGIHLATYEGFPLGWGKWLGSRMNNYFPKGLRIRMDIPEL